MVAQEDLEDLEGVEDHSWRVLYWEQEGAQVVEVAHIPYLEERSIVGCHKTGLRKDYHMAPQVLAGMGGNMRHLMQLVVIADAHRARHIVFHGVFHRHILLNVR